MTKGRPRTVRGAEKRGWPVVRIMGREDISWMGILNRVGRLTSGYAVNRYDMSGGGWMAFENPADAVMVQMKWGTLDERHRALPKPYPGWR
jgi:hypothetical protein